MTDDAISKAILAEPDDDMHRLVYADWLDEHGDPVRAEFLRVQIELAGAGLSAERRQTLQARQRDLLLAHETDWAAPLLDLVRNVRFRRGLVERVTLTVPDFLQYAEQIFALAPVRHAVFLHAAPHLETLAACPHLARLEVLEFRDSQLQAEHMPTLAASPHLANLTALILRFNQIGDDGLRTLAASPRVRSLTTLDLYEADISPEGVVALVASPPPHLANLVLGGYGMESGVGQIVAASPHLGELTTLHLAWTQSDDDDAQALADTPYLPRLRSLDLSYNRIGTAGARRLAGSPRCQSLDSLRLRGNSLGRAVRGALRAQFGDRVVL